MCVLINIPYKNVLSYKVTVSEVTCSGFLFSKFGAQMSSETNLAQKQKKKNDKSISLLWFNLKS